MLFKTSPINRQNSALGSSVGGYLEVKAFYIGKVVGKVQRAEAAVAF